MTLAPGTHLGTYEIVVPIGAGGMGEVYRARDSRLNRDVAVKIVPEALAGDQERRARFEREAQVLASLNHPNIAQIYGLEEHGAVHALVMELVPGRTLAALLVATKGGLPLDETVAIARQIADALEAAHERGVVHRDLKPGNVMLTDDDRVKVLDFGLARVIDPGSASDPANSPTVAVPSTQAGVILGTAAYMSPEQTKGRGTDKRSDIWSFGAVLYEMLTGVPAFAGETVSETLANVLKTDPDWSRLPVNLPTAIRLCVERCLIRDRHERLGDISTVKFLLSQPTGVSLSATSPISASPAIPGARVGRRRMAWALATLALAAAAGAAAWWLKPGPSAAGVTTRFQYALPEGQEFGVGGRQAAISPDGRQIVYIANRRLHLRGLGDLDSHAIPGTDEDPTYPVFSPDGKSIAYVTRPRATLRRISAAGGIPVTLTELPGPPADMTWQNGEIVLALTAGEAPGIHAAPENGGTLKKLLTVDSTVESASQPELVDATHVLFTLRRLEMAAAAGGNSVVVQSLDGGPRKTLVKGGSSGRVLASGQLAYIVDGTLRAVAFDSKTLETSGEPVVLASGVSGNYTVAGNGTLVYGSGATIQSRVLVWVDRRGNEQQMSAAPAGFFDVRLSPDGTQIALSSAADIWIWTIAKETLTRLTLTDSAVEYNPAWTSDGRYVVFDSSDGGVRKIFKKAVDGTGKTTEVTAAPGYPEFVSPDGAVLGYHTQSNVGMLQALNPPAAARPLIAGKAQAYNASLSPDGRWIAYQSDESGRFEVFVQPFPALDSGRWQVSSAGGTYPHWARSGRELFLIDGAGALTSVPVQTQSGFTFGKAVPLFPAGQYYVNVARNYDVSVDGTRFVFVKNAPQGRVRPSLTVVTHWFDEVREKMATAAGRPSR